MNTIKKVLNDVLASISLTKKEENNLRNNANQIIKQIKPNIKEGNILIGGSLAKGTIIKKEEQDVDIFIVFNKEESTIELDKILKKSKISARNIHGSREYFQLQKENITFEFIPIVKIDKEKHNKNVTDFSPLHVKYITKKANKSILNEIKLAKAFCKSQEVYGAESYIQGFSGYSLEILICYYTSFVKFLKGIQKDTFIDIEKMFKNKREAFQEINQSKLNSPIVLIDPTNKYRNICAGLSKDSLDKLKQTARDFLKSPSVDFFNIKLFDPERFSLEAKKKSLKTIKVELSTDRENKDIAGTKMKKFFGFIIDELNKSKQEVINSAFVYNGGKKSTGYLAIKFKETIEICGPKKEMALALTKFKKVRKNIYFSEGFACAKEKFDIEKFMDFKKKVALEMGVKLESFKIYN